MKAVVLGATKGMGRALARLLAERGEPLFLLGRNPAELEKAAADLAARGAEGEVGTAPCDLLQSGGFAAALDAGLPVLHLSVPGVGPATVAADHHLEQTYP